MQSNPTDRNSRGIASPRLARNVRTAEHPPRREAIVGRHGPADVDDVQAAAGTQDAVNLGCGTGFYVVVQMVQHHR